MASRSNPFVLELEATRKEMMLRKARTNYYDYVKLTNTIVRETKVHKWLTTQVQEFIESDTGNAVDIMLFSMPPQHGKSLHITETLPSWYMGKNPEEGVIIASYNEDFAKRFGRKNKQKIQEFGEKLFDIELDPSSQSVTNFDLKGHRGHCLSAGLTGGGITGNPAKLIIIDDPIKGRSDADSANFRDGVWDAWLESILTRLADGAKIIVIQTRWHEDDLYGRIATQEQYKKFTTVINIPLEADAEDDILGRQEGEPLCPEIGKGASWLPDFKTIYLSGDVLNGGSRSWNALYQGRPTALEGNFFKKVFWQYYKQEDIAYMPQKIISVDAAFKDGEHNDYVAIQVWGKKDKKYYLIELLRDHLNFPKTVEAIKHFYAKHPDTMRILIEDKANGSAIIQVLTKELANSDLGIEPVNPEGGKLSRAQAILSTFEAGRIYLPEFGGQDIELFIKECLRLPNAAHDDQVDAFTQAITKLIFVDANTVSEKLKKYNVWTNDMFIDYENASPKLQEELHKLWGYPLNAPEEDDVYEEYEGYYDF